MSSKIENPYAAFERALNEGRLTKPTDTHPVRRRRLRWSAESALTIEELISLGASEQPRRRRKG